MLSPSLLSLFGIFTDKSTADPLKNFENMENQKVLDKTEEKLIDAENAITEHIEGQIPQKNEASMWIT